MKVMIVDDAVFMRMMIRKIVESAGHEVVGEAADGEQAVERYAVLQPDLVTMDITMPNKDGIEATKEIRAIDPKAKILMTSAMGQVAMVKEALLNGAFDFIVKPIDETRFLTALSRAAGE